MARSASEPITGPGHGRGLARRSRRGRGLRGCDLVGRWRCCWGSGADRVVPAARVPSAPFVGLSAVSCPSAKVCTAVGALYRNTLALSFGSGVPVAERWNGRRWSLQRMPDLPHGRPNGLSVSCPSPSECSVVGSVTTSPSGSYPHVSVPLVERWSHRTWSIQRIARPQRVSLQEVQLMDVSCGAPTACMAVGTTVNRYGHDASPLAELWNGRAWSIQRLAGVPMAR